MKFFEIYETQVLEELVVNIDKNFFKRIERISGVTTILDDYSAHYTEYVNILRSVYNNFDVLKHKYEPETTYGDIAYQEIIEELKRRKNENKS